ncbi:asparagine synthase (glutamine-hydrolyzing) [Thermophagus sp. OGC60D27]|uniref:asparagine synthase (glutamine-hydrolyzing) n=1 Tax=Thermophagus sp. OGC60D27 TaxID=3458415 RepID=UPI004037CC65
MCGILGSINIPLGKKDLDILFHRGPDSFGLEKFSVDKSEIYLGHRRLSIVDLSEAGHQPMISDCGNYVVIFNGEIYNHKKLRSKLSGVSFRGHSDTETILYYLKKNWKDGLKDLNGIFALAIFDLKNRKALIARDPHGVKPLYYHKTKNTIIFSSEIRGIKRNSSMKLDDENLATLLMLRYNLSPYTLFSDINKVQPSHYIEIDFSDYNLKYDFGKFGNYEKLSFRGDFKKAVTEYGKYITNAVDRQLMSDVEIGVLLSGGIDSALVAALARNRVNYKMKAFTVGFEGHYDSDEIEEAQKTAEILDLEHHYVKISFDDFIKTLKKCNLIVEEPIATTSVVPMLYLSQLASKYVKVVLSGQGADEPLGGYFRYKGELLREHTPNYLLKAGINILKWMPFKRKEIFLRGINSLSESNDIRRFIKMYSIFSDEEIFRLIGKREKRAHDLFLYLYNNFKCKYLESSTERMMKIDARANLADDLLMYSDKITMNFSLENRVPFLDLELIKFVESLPIQYKINLKGGKIIHKEFAKTLLPPEIINRQKKGFKSPTKEWFKSNIWKIEEILLQPGTLFGKYFNQLEIEKIISRHLNGENMEKQLFLLLSLNFWFEENFN